METQTDPTKDRPPTPLFVSQKSGEDVATQIMAGELFDFDVEVRNRNQKYTCAKFD